MNTSKQTLILFSINITLHDCNYNENYRYLKCQLTVILDNVLFLKSSKEL